MPQGQPHVVPEDGLTTRQRRNRPLLMVHTGDGKGKSTAAFGLALRGWNQGWSIGGVPVREVGQVAASASRPRSRRSAAARRDRRGRAGRVAQDGLGLVLVAQAGRRGGPRRGRRRGLGRDQAPARRRGAHDLLRARRVHLPDEVGLGRRRRRRRDAGQPARSPARGDHRPARRPAAGRGRRPGHRDDQGQAPDGRRAEGPDGASSGDAVPPGSSSPRPPPGTARPPSRPA